MKKTQVRYAFSKDYELRKIPFAWHMPCERNFLVVRLTARVS